MPASVCPHATVNTSAAMGIRPATRFISLLHSSCADAAQFARSSLGLGWSEEEHHLYRHRTRMLSCVIRIQHSIIAKRVATRREEMEVRVGAGRVRGLRI